MAKQTPQEVIFGLIADEIFPPPAKAHVETLPSERARPDPEDFESSYLQEPVQRVVPLTQLQCRVAIDDERIVNMREAGDIESYILQSMAAQLAKQLARLLKIESQKDFAMRAVVYRASIYVATPKELRGKRSVNSVEMGSIKGA